LSGQKTHKLRPRLIGYALVLLAMMGLLAAAFFMRSLVGFDVSKDRVLYRENAEGRIENVYSLKIMNKDQRDHTYVLDAAGLPDLKLQGRREIKVAAGDIVSMPVELSSAPEQLPSSTNEVTFILTDADDASVHIEAKSRFIGPQVR
ncbi:FixG Ig-like domain-containing protein, partial [Stenotrophomonas maltophilia]